MRPHVWIVMNPKGSYPAVYCPRCGDIRGITPAEMDRADPPEWFLSECKPAHKSAMPCRISLAHH